MKTLFLSVLGSLIIFTAAAISADTLSNPLEMKQLVYASKIDGKLAFYQSLTYLTDSKCSILSEIGHEAVKKVNICKAYRGQMLNDMISSNVSLEKNKMDMFLTRRINELNGKIQQYSLN
ncbi:MAG: hypothetical protein KAR45_01405 [Desulfobacteraceae bacterium]|nr:hypothetical protein [Desulfobacteraceae bacterium]